MATTSIDILDLNFQGRKQTIAAYLVRRADAAVLIESGPGSTLPGLRAGLHQNGLSPANVTHLLLTHIHLDHAGAAGWLARQGAQVFVHPVGAPHMLHPQKLLTSAQRIYGDSMDALWGEFLPVPPEKLAVVQDGEEIIAGGLRFVALATPGHAEHHHAYLLEDLCFSGDIGGVRMPAQRYLRLPLVPPELHLEKWRASVERLQRLDIRRIAPTHFGIFDDPEWQLQAALGEIESTLRWLEAVMPSDPPLERLRQEFVDWLEEEARAAGVSADALQTYQIANPTWMSADGLQRYWRKFRAPA